MFFQRLRRLAEETRRPTDHIGYCQQFIPADGLLLDIGIGRGKFLCGLSSRGVKAIGVEPNLSYINEAITKAKEASIEISVIQGCAESLPFPDGHFDFVNCAEVTEHLENSFKACCEIFRVLKPGGRCYISFHNRFGLYDHHFHLYFINLMPRSWAEYILRLLGRKKDDTAAGRQKLSTMRYYSYDGIYRVLREIGFEIKDTREERIKKVFGEGAFPVSFYRLLTRGFYPDVFHFLLTKI